MVIADKPGWRDGRIVRCIWMARICTHLIQFPTEASNGVRMFIEHSCIPQQFHSGLSSADFSKNNNNSTQRNAILLQIIFLWHAIMGSGPRNLNNLPYRRCDDVNFQRTYILPHPVSCCVPVRCCGRTVVGGWFVRMLSGYSWMGRAEAYINAEKVCYNQIMCPIHVSRSALNASERGIFLVLWTEPNHKDTRTERGKIRKRRDYVCGFVSEFHHIILHNQNITMFVADCSLLMAFSVSTESVVQNIKCHNLHCC